MKLKNILLSTMMLLASGTVYADAKKVCDSGSEYQKYYVNYLNGIADLLNQDRVQNSGFEQRLYARSSYRNHY